MPCDHQKMIEILLRKILSNVYFDSKSVEIYLHKTRIYSSHVTMGNSK